MSIRQQIRDRAIFELNEAPPTGVPPCGTRRFVPGERVTEPRMAAFFGEEDVIRPGGLAGPIVKRSFTLIIQAIVAVNDPAAADDAVEPMLEHITAVMGNTQLNKLALDVKEIATLWQAGEGAKFYLVALTRWRIEYQTRRDDLTAKQ